jgi:hypothetical protein
MMNEDKKNDEISVDVDLNSLQLWRKLVKLQHDTEKDKILYKRIEENPTQVLRDYGIDFDVPKAIGSKETIRFSELIKIYPKETITKITKDLIATSPDMSMGDTALVAAVGVVVAVVAVVVAWVAGLGAYDDRITYEMRLDKQANIYNLRTKVELPTNYMDLPVGKYLTNLNLSLDRQRALLKRAVLEPQNLKELQKTVETQKIIDPETVKVSQAITYVYNGARMLLEFTYDGKTIEFSNLKLV